MNIKDIYTQNNLIMQVSPYSCGPCTLLNVLRAKGDLSHTEEEVMKLCDCRPEVGTTNEAMVRVAPQIGIEVVEEKASAEIADIERNLDSGNYVVVCYQYVYTDEGHYALITEQDEQAFYFRDPALGLFRLKKKYFKNIWYGSDGIKQWYMAVK